MPGPRCGDGDWGPRNYRGGRNAACLIILAVLTGVTGEVVRDVLCGDFPPLVLREEVYAVAALAGAVAYLALHSLGCSSTIDTVVAACLVFALRMAAPHKNLHLPRLRERRTTRLTEAGARSRRVGTSTGSGPARGGRRSPRGPRSAAERQACGVPVLECTRACRCCRSVSLNCRALSDRAEGFSQDLAAAPLFETYVVIRAHVGKPGRFLPP